jgi:hypothetical protein
MSYCEGEEERKGVRYGNFYRVASARQVVSKHITEEEGLITLANCVSLS